MCARDIKDYQKSNKNLSSSRTFTHHTATVNDVQFHPHHGHNLIGTVSDDLSFALIDLRKPSSSEPVITIRDNKDAVNALSFHPQYDTLLATGSADHTIGIFDMRYPQHGKIHSLEGHQDNITKIEWHPHDAGILASSSDDRRIIFWDISRAGQEQTPEDAEDGPPEMYAYFDPSPRLYNRSLTINDRLFMHGGHTNRISDFSWNKNDPWMICSAAEDNLIQCWRAARQLVEKLPPGILNRELDIAP